jgi:hypothetical protein
VPRPYRHPQGITPSMGAPLPVGLGSLPYRATLPPSPGSIPSMEVPEHPGLGGQGVGLGGYGGGGGT